MTTLVVGSGTRADFTGLGPTTMFNQTGMQTNAHNSKTRANFSRAESACQKSLSWDPLTGQM
jgi:hypothetical protein